MTLHETMEMELNGSFEIENQTDQSLIEFMLDPGQKKKVSIIRNTDEPGGYRILRHKSVIGQKTLKLSKLQESIESISDF